MTLVTRCTTCMVAELERVYVQGWAPLQSRDIKGLRCPPSFFSSKPGVVCSLANTFALSGIAVQVNAAGFVSENILFERKVSRTTTECREADVSQAI